MNNFKNFLIFLFLSGFGLSAFSSVNAAPITAERLANAASEPHNWLTVHKDFDSSRFSNLGMINRSNVHRLVPKFTVATGGLDKKGLFGVGGNEGTPLVNDGMMYVQNPWNVVMKIDVSSGNKAKILWVFDPEVPTETGDLPVTRGVALAPGLVIVNTLDGRVIALDDESGDEVWSRQVADGEGESMTLAPIVVGENIITSNSAGDWGTRGWIESLKVSDGSKNWRLFTIPAPGEPGSETWLDDHDAWKTGGGSNWQTGSVDLEQNVYIFGTGNPVPMYDPEARPGDNLFTNSVIAADLDTGEMKWYYQFTPGDYLDYDEIGVYLLYDTKVNGEDRKVVGHFGRNGFYYQMDRNNGSFITGAQYVNELNWTAGLDPKTGKPLGYDASAPLQEYVAGGAPRRGKEAILGCPHIQGGVNFFPTSYNPILGLAYGAGMEACTEVTTAEDAAEQAANAAPGSIYIGGGTETIGKVKGSLTAIDVNTGQVFAKYQNEVLNYAGVMSTPTLTCTSWADGEVACHDAKTLDKLWSFNIGMTLSAPPMTYAVGGKQYIAVQGGGSVIVSASGMNVPELEGMQPGSTLFVFGLN